MSAATRPTVLVVDDEPQVRALTTRILDQAGFTVAAASSASEALELLVGGVDLMVLDVRLPDLNGPDLALQVWRRRPALPILFISGWAEPAVSDPGVQALVHDFIPKPFTHDQLLTAVRRLLPDLRASA
jgi:CheY-like chemotaxis protein